MYEMLTGRPPFRAETATATLLQVLAEDPQPPAGVNPHVPRDLETICLKCLHKETGGRYASARELADHLVRFLKDEPIRVRPVGRWERSRRWLRQRPALVAGLEAAPLLGICLAGGGVWLSQRADRARAVEEDIRAGVGAVVGRPFPGVASRAGCLEGTVCGRMTGMPRAVARL